MKSESIKAIYKYEIENVLDQTVMMPEGARIISVQVQYGSPILLAIVSPAAPENTARWISIYRTGHSIYVDPGTYLGTFMTEGDRFIFHVFERTTS